MYVRFRRYRRQIHEKPLFVRPALSSSSRHSDRTLADDEDIDPDADSKKIKKKRTYTKRKITSGKDANAGGSGKHGGKKKSKGDDEKPAKRAYKKKSKTPKLKVKMLLKKRCHHQGHEADIDTDVSDDAEMSEMMRTMPTRDDDDVADMDLQSAINDHQHHHHHKVRKERRKQDLTSSVEHMGDYHVCTSTSSHSLNNSNSSSRQHHVTDGDTGDMSVTHSNYIPPTSSAFKLGNVKIELRKCGKATTSV